MMQSRTLRVSRYSPRSWAAFTAAVAAALATPSLHAGQIYQVTTNTGTGAGSLYLAITQADANGSSAGNINLANNLGTIDAAGLPDITVGVVINGGVGNTLSGEGSSRILFVNSPGSTVAINNLTFTDGSAHGGNGGAGGGAGGGGAGLGGAVFVNAGTVNFSSVMFTSNSVTGGTGANGGAGGGGGGGGLDFTGGAGASSFNGFFEGAGGGGGAHTSAGATASGSTAGTGGGAHGGTGGVGGGNGASP
jgi:hypothetical protein